MSGITIALSTNKKLKREKIGELLELGKTLIYVNARMPGVMVPERHSKDIGLTLNLSYKFRSAPILGDDGIQANLAFNSVPCDCFIPWDALYGAFSHTVEDQGMMWPMPYVVYVNGAPPVVEEESAQDVEQDEDQEAIERPDFLRVVDTPASDDEEKVTEEDKPKGPPKLTIV